MPKKRKKKNLRQKNRVLIYCEGEKTEIDYIKKLVRFFRISGRRVVPIHENSTNPWGLYDEALAHFQKKENDFDESIGDRIFIVSDVEEHLNSQANKDSFNSFIQKARNDSKCDYISNQPTFEFWLLSHFIKLDSSLDRKTIREKLKENDNFKNYEKEISQEMFDSLVLDEALRNTTFDLDETFGHQDNPHSLMFLLVNYLSKIDELG